MVYKKFVVYKRLSKEDKSRTQHGFDSQQMDVDHYLSQLGNTLVLDTFQEFVSGGADSKPELEKAIQLCKDTGATLLVGKLDRLSRRVSQIALLMENAVEFKVAVMPSANNFMLHLYASLAEEERANIRLRVKRGLEAAKAKGVKCGGSSPKHKATYQKNKALGLHKKSKLSEKATAKNAKVVEELTRMVKYSSDSLTYQGLANRLNSEGFLTSTGKTFSKATVQRLIARNNDTIKYVPKNKSKLSV